MPVYNGGRFFRLALQSALRQTYARVEIVVVNDGSTDGGETEAIAREYGSRIVYIRQGNKGVAGALNTAVSQMTGDYFTWLSHDDLHAPNKIERQLAFAKLLDKPDAILISDYDLIDPSGDLITTVRLPHQRMLEIPILPAMQGWINGCTVFIPAQIMRRHYPFDEELRYTQDYQLWNKILAEHDFFHQPEVLVQYRIHPAQDSQKPEAITEGNRLWVGMVESRSNAEQAQMFGSRHSYYSSMADFLDRTPYRDAAAHARRRATACIPDTPVSVVVPFWNEVALACRAIRSALAQTHGSIEVIAVDDGSTESITELEQLASEDARLRILRQVNAGPGAARNHGMQEASGEYIAFLDADDLFLPQKIRRQVQIMQQGGFLLSHTSYYINHTERPGLLGVMRSGALSGMIYPGIIGSCPIAMPTVMIHRTILAAGFEFPTNSHIAEDIVAWIELAMRHDILGIDEPLSVVEWSSTSAALNYEKSILGMMHVLDSMQNNPCHRHQVDQIDQLALSLRRITLQWRAGGQDLPRSLLAHAFSAPKAHAPGALR